MIKAIIGSAIIGSGIAAALLSAGPAHADEYGHTPDYSCTVTRHDSTNATISHQRCVDAFLYEAHVDNLISRPKILVQ